MKTTTTTHDQTTPVHDRTLCILEPIAPDGRGVVRITERISRNKVEVKTYNLTCFPAFGGEAIGVTWEQEDGTNYSVCLNGKKSTCECKGYLRWQKPCRHILAGFKLQEMGELRLPIVTENSEADSSDLDDSLSWDAIGSY